MQEKALVSKLYMQLFPVTFATELVAAIIDSYLPSDIAITYSLSSRGFELICCFAAFVIIPFSSIYIIYVS